ncbi:MAG TPA: hypothetical protein VFU45_05840 [Gemmatimonadales bacterium]|nr:hypothetical protein [Gemmatimonadales bacterium]
MRWRSTFLVLFIVVCAPAARAQAPAALAVRLSGMTAVTGFERAMGDTLLSLVPGSVRDRAGNVVRVIGAGTGGLLVACPMDEVGYVVGGIRADGWLTLRRVGGGVDPRYDRWLQGERITLWGRRGPRAGVVAVRSVHLLRGRGQGEAPFTVDDALVDVGASDRLGARALGLGVLTPVAREKRPIQYGNARLAAPWAGRRSACAALVVAAGAAHPQGRVVVAFVTEEQLGGRGLLTVANTLGAFDRTILVDAKAGTLGALIESPDSTLAAREPGVGTATRLDLPTLYPGTPVETVSLSDVQALADRLVRQMEGAR